MLHKGLKLAARRPQTSLNSLQEAANTYLVLITACGPVESPVFVTFKDLKASRPDKDSNRFATPGRKRTSNSGKKFKS